jgi:hypothetical protein
VERADPFRATVVQDEPPVAVVAGREYPSADLDRRSDDWQK